MDQSCKLVVKDYNAAHQSLHYQEMQENDNLMSAHFVDDLANEADKH